MTRSEEGPSALPAGTVTLLLGDVEGSTPLWQSRPAEMPVHVARLEELVDRAVRRNRGGRPLEQGEGDSFVASFPSAAAAVACALEIQRELAESPLRVRMGLHSGEVEVQGRRYVGHALNRTARLRDAGHGGQVLLSQAAWDLSLDALPDGASVVDVGVHRLKGLDRPEHLYQLCHPDLRADFPPLRSLEPRSHNLPVPLTSFVGRGHELSTLKDLVQGTRLLTLTGVGGCGKTRLALELASGLISANRDGAWLVDLTPVVDPKAVPSAIVRGLGLREDTRAPTQTVIDHFNDREAVLLLDNCEHVIDTTAAVAEALLRSCPSVTLLATSREPLRVAGEVAWPVPGLSTPDIGANPESTTQYESVELFVERAGHVDPEFALSRESSATVAEICRRLDGIPLAIELAAARARVLSPERILEGLTDRFRLLTTGLRMAPPRQQTLRASVDWSYGLLEPAERVLLRRLSVFRGGFTLDAAGEVTTGVDIDRSDVLDLLAGLAGKSLVHVDRRGSERRYRLLETIREYSEEHLVGAYEEITLRDRHAAHFLALAERAEPHLEAQDQDQWADLLEGERPNLRAALEWTVECGDGDSAHRLVAALPWFLVIRGHLRDGKKMFELALSTETGRADLRGRALQAYSYLCWHRGDVLTGIAAADEARALARAVEDRRTEGRAMYLAGFFGADSGAPLDLLDEAIVVAREASDSWCLAHALGGMGTIFGNRGDHARSRLLLEESVAVCEAMGDSYIVNTSRFWLARSLLYDGEREASEEMLHQVVARAREVGDTFSLPMALCYLAFYAQLRSEDDTALALLDEAIEISRRVGPGRESQLAMALWDKAFLFLDRGQVDAARRILLGLAEAHVGAEIAAGADAGLALIEVLAGDLDSARARLGEARRILPSAEPHDAAFLALVGAQLELAADDVDLAAGLAQEALDHDVEGGSSQRLSWTFEILLTLAGALGASGRPEDAVRVCGAIDAHRVELGRAQALADHPLWAAQVAVIRDPLGPDDGDLAWGAGAAMDLDATIALARSTGPRAPARPRGS